MTASRLSQWVKIASACLVVILIVILVAANVFLFRSRFICQAGVSQMDQAQYSQALDSFKRAEAVLPGILKDSILAAEDLYRIYTRSGIACHQQALQLWKDKGMSPVVTTLYKSSKTYLEKAQDIDPNTYLPSYWQAMTENSLETIFSSRHPKEKNPYDAGPLFEKAIRLRPNGINVHYAFARYLSALDRTDDLVKTVSHLAEIYPPVYFQLKKEKFFSANLLPGMKTALESALAQDISPRDALRALSDVYTLEGDYGLAAETYRKSLALRTFDNTPANFVQMGRLYLNTGDEASAGTWFQKALSKSDDFDRHIEQIFYIFKKQENSEGFLRLCLALEDIYPHLPASVDILAAQAWMDNGKYSLAIARLNRLNQKKNNPRAFYLLARIAQKQNDLDQMEINAQKATTLDRENSSYYHLFSIALHRQGKYASAEDIAAKAIQHDKKGRHWLYSHRAWTRWAQKKYAKAISDWNRAFSLNASSDYQYWMAMAYEREGLFKEGLAHIQKALSMSPQAQDKTQKYLELKKRLQRHKG